MLLYALYCNYMFNMFWALLCPSSGALDYMCVFAAYYGVLCLAAVCRGSSAGQQDVRAASIFLDAHPAALHQTPGKQQLSTAHHKRQIHTHIV